LAISTSESTGGSATAGGGSGVDMFGVVSAKVLAHIKATHVHIVHKHVFAINFILFSLIKYFSIIKYLHTITTNATVLLL
jgi:hypothetical protein